MDKIDLEEFQSADLTGFKWHEWFAWHPVVVDKKVHFLSTVYRRQRFVKVKAATIYRDQECMHNKKGNWDYGTLFDLLKDTEWD